MSQSGSAPAPGPARVLKPAAGLTESQLLDLAELASDWIWEQDAELRFVAVSGEYHGRPGEKTDPSLGRKRWELPVAGVSDEQWAAHRAQLDRHEPFRDFVFARADQSGAMRWYSVSGRPLFSAAGIFAGYRGIGREITAQKQTEIALRDGESRLRALLDLSSDWYWVQDENHRITVREGAVLERNGLPSTADIGKTHWELGYLNMTEVDWAAHRALLDRREEFRNLLLGRQTADGEVRWARLSGRPLYAADGRFIGYHGVGHGVTAEVTANQARRESEAQLRLIADNAPASIGYFDQDLVLRFVNRGFEHLWGLAAADVLGKPLCMLVSEAMYREIRGHFDLALGGTAISYRRLNEKPGAETQVLNVSLVPHRDEKGAVIGCYSVAMDLTANERAEARIRGLEARLASALETSTDLMAVYRVEGATLIIEQFNSAMRNFYEQRFGGIRITDWIGRPLEDFLREVGMLAPAAVERRLAPFSHAARTGQVMRYQSAIESPAGVQQRDALLVPITDGGGRVTHLFYRGADITELARRQEQLERLNADLERKVAERTAELSVANRELEAFAYSVSHDLRAPLRGIDGFSMLLMETHADALGADGMSHVQRIRRGIQRMGALIDDLLKLSRVTRGPLKREKVDLSAIAAEIAADLQRQAIGRHVEWRLAPAVSVLADSGLMRVLLENLLGNAWKYTRDSVAPVIEFGAHAVPGGLELFVRDNGAGFDMAYAEKLFQAFQRLHGPKEFEGTGIGLATVARIVERHGGRVRGHGEPGKGALFQVYLPEEGARN